MFLNIIILKVRLILVLLFVSSSIIAQEKTHYDFWNRITISQPITKSFKAEIEFQNRWQNDYYSRNTFWFEYQLMNSIRLWGYYQLNPKISVFISPFAYFENSPIIKNDGNENKVKSYENRYTIGLEWKQNLFQKTFLIYKNSIEYRDFKNTSPDYFRFREKLGLKQELNSKWSLFAYDELFINAINSNGNHFFDQNRIGFSVNLNANKNLKFELGYLFNVRSQKNSSINLQENNLILNTYFTIPNKRIKSNGNHS